MKFIASASALLKQLNLQRGIVPNNPVIPILENFLFELDGNTLTVTAGDLQTTIISKVSVEGEESGKVALPARMLIDTLKNLPEQPITIIADSEQYGVEVHSENGRYKLAGEDYAEFPKPPALEDPQDVNIDSDALRQAIDYTLFAASNDDMKPAMNGVYVHIGAEHTNFVSTDSHRLVRYRRTDVAGSGNDTSMIIPSKALSQLQNALPSSHEEVKMSFDERNASFTFGNIHMICRLIDEKFPDYENVIPTNNDKILNIDRQQILSTLKRIVIYANQSTNQVRLNIKGDSLEVSAEDLDFSNEASESIACRYDGEELNIGFNAKFLIEMLTNLSHERVLFHFSEPSRAALLFDEEQAENEDLLMLVMPVMLNDFY